MSLPLRTNSARDSGGSQRRSRRHRQRGRRSRSPRPYPRVASSTGQTDQRNGRRSTPEDPVPAGVESPNGDALFIAQGMDEMVVSEPHHGARGGSHQTPAAFQSAGMFTGSDGCLHSHAAQHSSGQEEGSRQGDEDGERMELTEENFSSIDHWTSANDDAWNPFRGTAQHSSSGYQLLIIEEEEEEEEAHEEEEENVENSAATIHNAN
ncbi:uncharacterized protein JN550_011819 [Neoarthrinium moseri]|uniref:uncharacterized protein n=1 Tax=Neoarthrinium moseri TaxID=1658444 RepID=UPI001FDE32E2|nr:uncharacterized protein JN550_011819 [Neoarthrinium moseri]KAI1859900.1 hypothetical protein JN550_011819 [Neoarthrinium moseri]